jgi:hypothetical protein
MRVYSNDPPHAAASADGDILAATKLGLTALYQPGDVHELRAVNTPRGILSGFYDDLTKLAHDAIYSSDALRAAATYITVNPVDPKLLARAKNHLREYAKHTTTDAEIVRRRFLLLDFDPVRPADIAATDEEHAAALAKAIEVRQFLRGRGWPGPHRSRLRQRQLFAPPNPTAEGQCVARPDQADARSYLNLVRRSAGSHRSLDV